MEIFITNTVLYSFKFQLIRTIIRGYVSKNKKTIQNVILFLKCNIEIIIRCHNAIIRIHTHMLVHRVHCSLTCQKYFLDVVLLVVPKPNYQLAALENQQQNHQIKWFSANY